MWAFSECMGTDGPYSHCPDSQGDINNMLQTKFDIGYANNFLFIPKESNLSLAFCCQYQITACTTR